MSPRRSVRTRRWNDPAEPGDGARILIARYRPRGVRRTDETWDEWWPDLGPSKALHAAAYGKDGPALAWSAYRDRFLAEIAEDPGRFYLRALAERVGRGEAVTLLCSSACVDPDRCHRTIVRGLISG
jgi:uncharacterized protein YeaO (DUF488 family)